MKEMTMDTPPPIAPGSNTIGEALADVFKNPSRLVRQWNYKGAILSATLRAPIFLITYLVGRESIRLALGAALVQFIFRLGFAGVGGALIQAFRRVEPAWKALAAILLIIPVISHFFEFLVQLGFAHLTQTGDHTTAAILRSVCISILSALFSLYIMRKDVLIVGEADSKSIWNDIGRFPRLIFDFVMFVPLEITKMLGRGEFLLALLGAAGVALFAQILGWAMTGKLYWTYDKGKTSWASVWAVDGLILLVICVALSAIILRRTGKKSEFNQTSSE